MVCHGRIAGRPPVVLLFFLIMARMGMAQWPLAVELFAEKDWVRCRRECLRVLSENPQWPSARVLAEVSRLWISGETQLVADVEDRLSHVSDRDLRATSHYELGRFLMTHGDARGAARHFENAFLIASDSRVSDLAGCALYRILRAKTDPPFDISPSTRLQLETAAATWDEETWRATDFELASPPLASKPAEWIVAVYRRQIAPAIGARCSLSPSCSQYFKEAGSRHGLMAFPIMADRLVREPSVVQRGEHPIVRDGHVRFRDEVEWHTYWWTGEGGSP